MKKIFSLFMLLIAAAVFAAPKITFEELLVSVESNPSILRDVKVKCAQLNIPFEIYTDQRVIIAAKGFEDGQVVYAVIRDAAKIYNNSEVMFFNAVQENFNLNASKIVYGDGRIVDNTNGLYNVVLAPRNAATKLVLVPEWTNDNVFAFDAVTGDLVDNNFIPPSPSQLGSPKQALQTYKNKILVSDQITDGVFMFDTSGTFISLFAPAGGINTAILDNLRGINFRANKNLLVTVGSGASQNTIQQFDTAGVTMGAFINSNVNSPFDILVRQNDILISNSSGTNDVTRYNLDGTFNAAFIAHANISFAQGMQRLPNGNISVCAFSGATSGLYIFDSTGVFINYLNGATGARGSWRLANGNFLVTNGAGIHEINGTTGALIRTISAAANFQFFGYYDPDILVGITPVQNTIASEYKLFNNYPNPFNPETNIRYSIPKKDFVSVKVYNSIGKEVASYVNKIQDAGVYEVKFSGNNLSSGVYYYKLEAGEFRDTQKMILIK